MQAEYIRFDAERVAGGSGPFTVIVDAGAGVIAYAGEPREATAWLEARGREGALVAEEISCGALLPGMTEGHNHPCAYSCFEMLGALQLIGVADTADVVKRIASASARLKDPAQPLLAVALDTSKAPGLNRHDLDEAGGGRPVFVLDTSLHSGIASTSMAARVRERAEAAGRPLVGYLNDAGRAAEEYAVTGVEILEESQPAEKIESALERKLDSWLAKGMTTVHELLPFTTGQFMAALRLRRRWRSERACGFPITRFYLNRFQILDVLTRLPELEREGLLSGDEFREICGMKFFADGSFGAHTAKVSEPYRDTGETGIFFYEPNLVDEDFRLAAENGICNIAFHAIGDLGIRLALDSARKWMPVASRTGLPAKFRIEHFSLPVPCGEALDEVKDMGLWLCMQPNFVLDYVYEDRLGERIKTMLPQAEVLSRGIPLFLGTDGMPDSMMFALWLATHAAYPVQKMTLPQAIEAAAARAGEFDGGGRGRIAEGQAADLIAADASLLADLEPPDEPDTNYSFMKMFELEGKIKKVFKSGVQVYPKKKK